MTPGNLFEQMQANYKTHKSRAVRAETDRAEQEKRREDIKKSLQGQVEEGVKIIDDAMVHADLHERVDAAVEEEIEERKRAAMRAEERDRARKEKTEKKIRLFGRKKAAPADDKDGYYYDDDPDFYEDESVGKVNLSTDDELEYSDISDSDKRGNSSEEDEFEDSGSVETVLTGKEKYGRVGYRKAKKHVDRFREDPI